MTQAGIEQDAWRSATDIWVQVVGPRFGWVWVQNAMHHDYETWVRLPAGTVFRPPRHVTHGPPVGAYVCAPAPDDDRDDKPWLAFELIHGFGPFDPGAILEMRPPESRLLVSIRG